MSLNSKAHEKIKKKLATKNPNHPDPFSLWQKFYGFFSKNNIPMRNNEEMTLDLNKSKDHCICNHKTGHIKTQTPKSNIKHTPHENKVAEEVNEKLSRTNDYKEASLIPLVQREGNTVIFVGKDCMDHFHKTSNETKKSYTSSQHATGNIMFNPLLYDMAYDKTINDIICSLTKQERSNPSNIIIVGQSSGRKIILSNLDTYGIQDMERIYNSLFNKKILEIPIQICKNNIILHLQHTLPCGIILANITFVTEGICSIIKIKNYTMF